MSARVAGREGLRHRPAPLPLGSLSGESWSNYRMDGPNTPAPVLSPGLPDAYEISHDSLSYRALRSTQSHSQIIEHSPEQLLDLVAHRLNHEQRTGAEQGDFYLKLCGLVKVSPDSIRRFEMMRKLLKEEQTLAQEGDTTSWRPGLYFLLALAGRTLIGMGSTLLEHLVLPDQPSEPGTLEPKEGSPPVSGTVLRPSRYKVMGGAVMLGVGILCALGAAGLFWRQANIRNPRRAATLTTLHVTALALIILHSFLFEYTLFNRTQREVMLAYIPGVISTGLYAYTVPNSLMAAEVQLGLTPVGSIERRTELALVLNALGLAFFSMLLALSNRKDLSSYAKQGVLISAVVCCTTGTGLAFTNARRYQSRLERGRVLRERARQASLSHHGAELGAGAGPRRPTALPENLSRDLMAFRQPTTHRSHASIDSASRILNPSGLPGASTTVAHEAASTCPVPSEEALSSIGILTFPAHNDYFSLPLAQVRPAAGS